MKRMKKITDILLIFALIASILPAGILAEEQKETYTVLWQEDFENMQDGAKGGTANLYNAERVITDHSDGYTAKINVDGKEKKTLGFSLDKPINSGTVYIAYDVYSELSVGSSNDTFITDVSVTGNLGSATGIMFASKLTTNKGLDWTKYASKIGSMQKEAGMWQRMESWLDFDAGIADFYIDGVQIGSTEIGEVLPQFGGWRRINRSNTAATVEYLDNIVIAHVQSHGVKSPVPESLSVPYHWKCYATVGADTEVLGGTFYSEEAKLIINAKNIYKESFSGKLKLKVTDEQGCSIYEEIRDISLGVSEEKSEEFKFSLPHFGFFDVCAELENTEYISMGFEVPYTEYKIVRVKESEVQNENLGYSTHSSWGHGTEVQAEWNEVLSKAGFKLQRDAIYWTDIQPVPDGAIELLPIHKNTITNAKNNNIDIYMLLGGPGNNTDDTKHPDSEEELQRFYKYVYEVVSRARAINPNIKYVEFFNEYEWAVTPEVATAVQKVGYEAAHAAYPDIVVVGGVTARFPLDWIESILKAGFGEYIDAFSGHPYTSEAKPEDTTFRHGTSVQQVTRARELLDRYGYQDKEIILSELSYTAYAACETEVDQASYGLRQYIMTSPLVEKYIWYNAINKKGTGKASEFEGNYGLLKSWAYENGVLYQAKPVVLAFGAYNDLLAQAEHSGRVQTEDKDIWIYKFKTRKNEDVIAIWNCMDDIETIGLDLGIKNAELYDMYGNKTEITADEKGLFNIVISGELTYIKGDFDKIEVKQSDLKQPFTEYEICMGETYSLPLNLPEIKGTEIEIKADSNLEITKADFNSIDFKVGYSAPQNSGIKVIVKKDGAVLYQFEILLKYVEPVVVSGMIKPYNTRRYLYEIDIKNAKKTDISATLTISEPKSLKGNTYTINKIVGGDTKKIRINIPIADANTDKLTLTGNLDVATNEGTQKIPVNISKHIGCIKYTDKNPVIDGKIDSGEWDTYLPMRMNKGSLTKNMEWGGTDDLSAEIYTMCDDNFLYLAAVVTDDVFYDKDTPQRVWAVDSLQFAVATERKIGARNSEFGMGISNGEVTLQRYTSQAINDGVIAVEFDKETEYAVKRYENEKKTVYELKIKISDVYDVVPNMKNLKNVIFAVCINDHDGDSRGWMEYTGGGIAGTKSPVFYMELPVYGN